MLVEISLLLCRGATGPADNGRAQTPPQGWRHWNQWNGAISQDIIEGNMRGLADRSRMINGKHASLADIGYSDAGIDDGWQTCGNFGPEHYRYHDASGNPVVSTSKFPDLGAIPVLAHSLNLTAGWYGNACGCVDGCCSDHCDTLECFVGDVNATLALGFDSYKLDGCGAQRDIALWAELFNHSITLRRNTNTSARANPVGMMIENCHDDDGLPKPGEPGANEPYYNPDGSLWCPFHTYRTSGDARPTYGSLLNNLNTTRRLAANNLSLPGCWAYPDMMEVGVTAMAGMHDCGPTNKGQCYPLNHSEARSHFGAWAIVSSPLVLGFDLRNQTMVDIHWDTVTNTDAIEVNQDYAGHSGSQFAESGENTTQNACSWKAGVTCDWPTWTSWNKPLSKRDGRKSEMAVLLMNNGDAAATMSFTLADVPGLLELGSSVATASCEVYDVWNRKSLGRSTGLQWSSAAPIAPKDSVFLTLAGCT